MPSLKLAQPATKGALEEAQLAGPQVDVKPFFGAADAFVLWGSNMAEMHPVLWSRVTDRCLSAPATARRLQIGHTVPVADRQRRSLRLRTRVTLFFSLTALVAGLALAVVTYAVARTFLVDQRGVIRHINRGWGAGYQARLAKLRDVAPR